MNRYQVFIASSLRIQEYRQAAINAINVANEDQKTKQHQIEFEPFLYENCSDIPQKVEKKDAQDPADQKVKKSTLFFLIIDDVIRSMTQHEFYVAYEQFKHGGDPQYIFILYNGEPKESNSEGLNYEDFMKKYNLEHYVADSQYDIVLHRKVYAIPFTGIDNLQERIRHQLLAFVSSEDRPLSGALRSYNLTKDHFFTDVRRKENCPEAYLRRSFDDQLDSAISEGKRNFVALIGHSLSGKTRAVMEAMKAVDDGWVYIVNMEDAATEYDKLVNYLNRPDHQKLYIVLDDYDQWADQNPLSNLFEKIWGSNDVIVATASSKNCLPDKDDQKVEWIEIKEMDEREFGDVRDFFISAGADFDKGNLRYHRTGALFVNLKEIKKEYSAWLNQGIDLIKVTKKALLKAIKALSIWRDDNIGNRTLMEKLTTWFCKQEMILYDGQWTDVQLAKAYEEVMNDLIHDKRKGVSSAGKAAPIIVQEYIYRYFIDYDGSLLDDDKEFEPSPEKEMKLVRELLLFCSETIIQEPLTAQVSRLCRRCAYKKKTVGWLYKLWSSEDCEDPSDIHLSKILNDDRIKCENTDDELITHFYSNLIENYIYKGCNKLEDARTAFEKCPEIMRTDHLFSALMRKAKHEEREEIRNMPDYTRFKGDAYVIAVEVEWAENYKQAEDWMKTYTLYGKTPREMAVCVRENNMPYDLLQLRRSVTTLAFKVSNSKEFEDFCELVAHLYPYLADDAERLKGNLTRIDQLAVVQPYALASMLGNVFGGDLTASEEFVKSLLGDVEKTLDGQLTDEHALRLTFGYAVSKLIKELADVPYDEVYNRIFKPLKTKYKNKPLILRNIYTYTAMLSNSSCDMQKANNLLMTDLHHHMQDKDNPLTLNTIAINMILEKSSGKNKGFNVDMINRIYDQLHRQRDSFTYRHLLSASTSLEQALSILKEMQDRKVKPNIYTLCELMKQPFIKLRTALTMLDLTNVDIPEDYELKTIKPIEDLDPDNKLRKNMSDTHVAWGCLFKKKCRNNIEKEVLAACLSYLEKEKRELLEGGYVYNCLISNESYLPFVNDVKTFIEKKRKIGSFPDSFTAKYMIDRITQLNGLDRLKALERLNEVLEMIMETAKCKIDYHVINSRLRIFRNQGESLKMDFYDEQGEKILKKGEPLNLSVIGYLKTMSENGYPVELYGISSYLAIVEEQQGNPYKKLMEEIPGLEHVLNTPSEHNKMLLWQFKAGEISIDYAFQNLDWTNEYATICIFSEILNCYIHSQPRTQALFQQVKNYYDEWITNKNRFTTSITLSVLAKATTCWEDIESLLKDFEEQQKKNPRLSLTPQMLSAISGCANSVQELIEWSDALIHKGCPRSSKAADSYVHRMVSYLLQRDHDNVAPILDDLCQYIVEGSNENDTNNMLVLNKRNSLMLDLYKDQKNISPSLLCSLIYYNATETKKYTTKQIINCIKDNYYRCIIPLMEMLAADATNESSGAKNIARDYIPRLFPEVCKINRPPFSARLLSYLAYGLSKENLDGYRQFLKQLYEMDCRGIEGAVPGLADCLKKYINSHPRNKDISIARKALARIIVYTKLKRLRNQALLLIPDKTSEGYVDWMNENADWMDENAVCCHHLMDCETLIADKDAKWQKLMNIQWSDLIKYYTNWLDDAYPCSLTFCYKKVSKEHPLADELMTIISQQEHCYAQRIETGMVYFKDVLKLPLMWVKAKWKASEELLIAMVRSISRMAYDPNPRDSYYIDEYIGDARKRCDAILNSCKTASVQKKKTVLLYYEDLGIIPDENDFCCQISLSTMRALRYDMSLDRLIYACAKGSSITEANKATLRQFEKYCADFIMKKGFDIAWLQQLPGRWIQINDPESPVKNHAWHPDEAIVLAMLNNYIRISKGKGKKASIARGYIDEVRTAMANAYEGKEESVRITYSMLGIMEDKEYYLLVPLKSLSKIKALNSTSHPSSKS